MSHLNVKNVLIYTFALS